MQLNVRLYQHCVNCYRTTVKFPLSTPSGCMGEVGVYLHSFLTSVRDGVEWLISKPLHRRLNGPQRRCEQFGEG